MKKYILFAAFALLTATGKIWAGENRDVPTGPADQLQSADYGGVDRTTISFTSANVYCFAGPGVVYGYIASSGTNTSDFIIFRDSGALIGGASNGGTPPANGDDYNTNFEFARVYVATAQAVYSNDVVSIGSQFAFQKPIRVYKGLCVKASAGTYNMITVLWTKFGQKNNLAATADKSTQY